MKATYLQILARKAPKTLLATPRKQQQRAIPQHVADSSLRAGAGLPLFHSSNPDHPESALDDPEAPPLTKEDYWSQAQDCLNQADRIDPKNRVLLDCRGKLALALAVDLRAS